MAGKSAILCTRPVKAATITVKDPEKLIRIAKEWGVETEGKDIYDLAHEIAELALLEYGKPFGTQRFLKRAPEHTQKLWHDAGIEPRAIDREVSTVSAHDPHGLLLSA